MAIESKSLHYDEPAHELVRQLQNHIVQAQPWNTAFLFLEPGCAAIGQGTPLAKAVEAAMKAQFELWASTWIKPKLEDLSNLTREQREVIRQAHELVALILAAAEDQVSINLELGQTHEERERRKIQLMGFIRRNLDKVIDRAEPFMAAAAPFLKA